jgi:hypothetical protein
MRRSYVAPMMRVVIQEDGVPGGPLNLNSTNLPRPWSPWESSPSGKIPTVEPGIEPMGAVNHLKYYIMFNFYCRQGIESR